MSADSATAAPEVRWRFRLGVLCFVAAFGVHLIVTAVLGAGAGTVAAIAGVNFAINKILLVATIGLLGKSGFNYLRSAAGDVMLLASLRVLGGDFWDKLRALFVRRERATLPGEGQAAQAARRAAAG